MKGLPFFYPNNANNINQPISNFQVPIYPINAPYYGATQPSSTSPANNPNVMRMVPTDPQPLSAQAQEKFNIIHAQIKQYTGADYKTSIKRFNDFGIFNPAVSFLGNTVMLDDRLLTFPIEVIGFAMAHEWAHNFLGHDAQRQSHKMNMTEITAQEDEADRYAIQFLIAHQYPIEQVYAFNSKVNNEGGQPTAGVRRNEKLKIAYENALKGPQIIPNQSNASSNNYGLFRAVKLEPTQTFYTQTGYNPYYS